MGDRCRTGRRKKQAGIGMMHELRAALAVQRWDDHRYYHHSRINQSLHLVSALSFLAAYVIVFVSPLWAALIGWLFAMLTRQTGHFFFEPKGYDAVNRASHAHKEQIKVGYNLKRKVVLLGIWALSPLALWASPTLFGVFATQSARAEFLPHLGQIWLALGAGALVFRVAQLWIIRDAQTAWVWLVKILTDPIHDIMLYHRAPLYLLRGELIDPMNCGEDARSASPSAAGS